MTRLAERFLRAFAWQSLLLLYTEPKEMTPVRHQDYEVIRIMVASPSDVINERNCTQEVIENVNKNLAMRLGIIFEIRRWEDVSPAMHDLGAQGRIDSELDIADCDYVVGIFWKRFGTPTKSGETGAEHEIRKAYALWIKHKRPQVMLYFSKDPYSFSTPEEVDQLKSVLQFREEFHPRGLVKDYTGPEVFCTRFRDWLTRLVAERVNDRGTLIRTMPCFVSASSPYLRAGAGITLQIGLDSVIPSRDGLMRLKTE
jgi:hypothetical protein